MDRSSPESSLRTLYEDLHTLAPKWSTFGIHLGVPHDVLKGLQGEDSMVERCFINVLSTWLNNENASVDKLAAALRFPGVSHGRLAREIEQDRHNVKLKLPYLIKRLSPCKSCWFTLGLALDVPTEEIKKFESERKCPGVVICLENTLRLWLHSEDTDLDTLVEAIKHCGHGNLSREIEKKYKNFDFSSLASVSSQSTATSSSSADQADLAPDSHPTSTVTSQQTTTSATQKRASYDTTDADDLSDMSKPTSANLTLIEWRNPKGEVKAYRLITSIMHRWEEVGHMVAPRPQMEVWSKGRMDDKGCCRAMLFYWMDNPPSRYPVTWEGLYKLLNHSELPEIAHELKMAVDNAI